MINSVAIPKTLSDYVKAKDEAFSKLEMADRLINEAEKILKSNVHYCGLGRYRYDSLSKTKQGITTQFWHASLDLTGFRKFMDQKAITEFERSLERDPPEFNEANIRSTFISAQQDAEMMFNRGWLSSSGSYPGNTNLTRRSHSRSRRR